MLKIFLLSLLLWSNSFALVGSFTGQVQYIDKGLFTPIQRIWNVQINFHKNKVFFYIPEHGCKSELVLQTKENDIGTYKEYPLIVGSCKYPSGTTILTILDKDTLSYLFQSKGIKLTSTLRRVKR